MVPFHVRFIEEIVVQRTECIGLFKVSDFIKLSQTCKRNYKLIIKYKLIKRLIRYGNLDTQIRVRFWRKLSPFYQIQEELRDEIHRNVQKESISDDQSVY
jgi:hypothetical protein